MTGVTEVGDSVVGSALIFLGLVILFIAFLVWVSRRLWPDEDEYEILEWDDD